MRFALEATVCVALALPACGTPAGELDDGEAVIRYLGHSGWAVETRSRLLVFDYRDQGGSGPPSLEVGRIDPAEIRDRSVVVFVSHSHGDHWDPGVLEWAKSVPDITYVFGWRADQGPDHVYCEFERQDLKIGEMRVRTIVHDFDGIPESAFLVELDGLTIFHSGDHGNGPPPFRTAFVDNLDHLASIAPEIDLAFLPLWGEESFVVRKLKPRFTFPMHAGYREQQYAAFAARAREEKLPTRVVAARAMGDRFLLSGDEVDQVPPP